LQAAACFKQQARIGLNYSLQFPRLSLRQPQHLLQGLKTCGDSSGENQWAALCAAYEKVGQFSESQLLVLTY